MQQEKTKMAVMSDDNKGDFKDKQFAEGEVADKVVEQYDLKQARVFYKYVMVRGGGKKCLLNAASFIVGE